MGIAEIADLLACPRCQARMSLDAKTLRCPENHSYDLAKQGHVNLLGGGQPPHADTADMVACRVDFLDAGHYAPIADAVEARLGDARRILDVGAGTGWYLSRWLQADESRLGLALDISVAAARRAAKAHPRLGAIVADTWAGIPVRDGVLDAVTCVFAPRNIAEFARILRPGGLLVVVTPTPRHLVEARGALGLLDVEPDKADKLARAVSGSFEAVGATTVERPMHLGPTHLRALVEMGPNAFHDHAAPQTAMDVTLSVDVAWFRRPLG